MNDKSHEQSSMAEALPAGYVTVQSILNLSDEALRPKPLVNVIGVLNDFQAPKRTGGTDSMCTLGIADNSVDGQSNSIKFVVFGLQDKMPQQVNRAALVIIKRAKAQVRNGCISLLASWTTEYYIVTPGPLSTNSTGNKPPTWSSHGSKATSPPSAPEIKYALYLQSKTEDMDLPSDTEFETRVQLSTNFKDKFRLLEELQDTGTMKGYADLIGQVVKTHDGSYEQLEVYLTDYTQNEGFFNYVWGAKESEDFDAYGYKHAQPQSKKSNEWPGPYGKHTIQVTLYDPHASYARNKVNVGQWVQLSNVRIKVSPRGYLEGTLHSDNTVKVDILKPEELSSSSTPNEVRLHEAIKRKVKWTKNFEKQQKAYNETLAAGPGEKRKREDDEDLDPRKPGKTLNSKQRRKLDRAIAEKRALEDERQKDKLRNLNQNITCNFLANEATTLKEILKPQNFESGGMNVRVCNNINYRANVRVVDYFPPRLEDFAVGWRESDLDFDSDFSGDEDTDIERNMKAWRSGQGHPKNKWEWRFALEVEDAESDGLGERMWLVVDNPSAQMLLNLDDDATSLRNNPELLEQLREQLFKLWGDLEERKSASLPKEPTIPFSKVQKLIPSSTNSDFIASSPPPRPGGYMPTSTDSDEENSQQQKILPVSSSKRSALNERDSNSNTSAPQGKDEPPAPVRNKAFACCIQQYGVKVDEEDESKANAGEGKKWQRMFRLHGTMIK